MAPCEHRLVSVPGISRCVSAVSKHDVYPMHIPLSLAVIAVIVQNTAKLYVLLPVQYRCHCTNSQETHSLSTDFCKEFLYRISSESEKQCSR
jgi:hypothetical protein